MLFIIFFIAQCLSKDVAYFPNFCIPLPEALEMCIGDTITRSLYPTDFENYPPLCTSTTSPEKCYFFSLSSDIIINDQGEITFTATSKGIFSYDILIYDNDINSDYLQNFDYYNMAKLFTITFTVYNSSDISNVFVDLSNAECNNCPSNCTECFKLQCGIPFIGRLTNNNPGRLEFYLNNTQNIEVTVLQSGYFYTTPACTFSSQVMSWSVIVYDKRTRCSKMIKIGDFYPNTMPKIISSKKIYTLYNSKELNASISVYSQNHLQDELTVSLISNYFYLVKENNQGLYTVYCKNELTQGQYNICITVTDTGIKGINIMQNTLCLVLIVKNPSLFNPVNFKKVSVVKYSGD